MKVTKYKNKNKKVIAYKRKKENLLIASLMSERYAYQTM